MSKTATYVSKTNSKDKILVTYDKDWSNIKFFAKGKLQLQIKDGTELRSRKRFEIDNFGHLELELNQGLEISLNDTYYERETHKEIANKISNVSLIFWVLAGFNFLGFLVILMFGSELVIQEELILIVSLQLFAILAYALTAYLLRKGFYWIYFVGTSIYTLFSLLTLLDLDTQLSSIINIIILLIRFALLGLILRQIPTILKQMRANSSNADDLVLDQD